jgi:hypothetical protein
MTSGVTHLSISAANYRHKQALDKENNHFGKCMNVVCSRTP